MELKEYLGTIVEMEKEVDLQGRLCCQLKKKVKEHGDLIAHFENKISRNVKPEKPKDVENGERDLITSGIICSALNVLFSVGVLAFYWDMKSFAVEFGFVAEFIIWGRLLLEINSRRKENRKRYKWEMKKYEVECEKVQNINSQAQNQIVAEKIQKQTAEAYLQQVENALAASKSKLEILYAHNIIFPKYRNYVMVCSIYEYICAGRCTTLEGHEGAYNILELEIRLDRIVTQLDAILSNLAAIQANQYTLYVCLQESNQKIDMLLQEESQIAACLQEVSKRTASISARLALLLEESELHNYLESSSRRILGI